MSIMAMARAHLAGEHAVEPAKGCGLCPACPSCGGRGAIVAQGKGYPDIDRRIDCRSCSGTGSRKGDAR